MNFITSELTVMICSTFFFFGCLVHNPRIEDCEEKELGVTSFDEGGVKDIVFNTSENKTYYINRGLENHLDLSTLEKQVLNKKVTLHLAKTITGTSEYIAQFKVGDTIIYTEFK